MNNEIDWNKKFISSTLLETKRYHKKLLQSVSSKLNSYLKTNETEYYFNILLSDWLSHLIHQSYAIWQEDKEQIYKNETINFQVCDNIEDYSVYRLSEEFNYNLNKLINLFKNNRLDADNVLLKKNSNTNINTKFKSHTKIKNFVNNSIFNPKNKKIIIYEHVRRNTHFDFYLNAFKWRKWLGIKPGLRYETLEAKIDIEWRRDYVRSNYDSINYENLIFLLVFLVLPKIYLESYHINRDKILNINKFRPKYFYSSAGLYNQETKILIAEWIKEGTKLLYHQHGGNYGMDETHLLEDYETTLAHKYYSWGWEDKRKQNIHVLPVPSIKKPSLNIKRVLLCTTDYPSFIHRIHFQPMGHRIKKMHDQTLSFIKYLNVEMPIDLRLPLKNHKFSITSKLNLNSKIRRIDISDRLKINMPKSYSFGDSIIIHSYLCTSWLETIGLDIPTICFYDPEVYGFRAESNLVIDKLERVGILHKSGYDAACHLNAIKNNILAWWHSSETSDARNSFKNQYANFSSNWYLKWDKEFSTLVD